MKESYEEGLANRLGPEPYAGGGNIAGVALGMGTRRPAIELRKNCTLGCRPCVTRGKATRTTTSRRDAVRPGGAVDPVHAWKLQAREPRDPIGLHGSDIENAAMA